jgi:phospholipase C
LTNRDRAAASLGDVLTLAKPRTDDPLAGVLPPASAVAHPSASTPTKIDSVHAALVAGLPIRNEQGHYPENAPVPALSSTADLGNFIRDRTAAWKEHVQRQKRRREERGNVGKRIPGRQKRARTRGRTPRG